MSWYDCADAVPRGRAQELCLSSPGRRHVGFEHVYVLKKTSSTQKWRKKYNPLAA